MNEQRKIETEEVEAPAKPPKARVDPPRNGEGGHAEHGGGADATSETPAETLARKRDYLDGFLSQPPRPAEPAPVEPGGDLYEDVIEALKEIYDPEIPVNIYDLGLIYDVKISPENHAKVIHQRLGAVVPGADRHTFLVQYGAEVVRVNPIERETDDARAVLGSE